ncbi:MAG: metallophosphoesterase [Candidatus Xenobia bacterium]
MRRKVIAIGDLHGDVNRLIRILERQKVLEPNTRRWVPAAGNFDVVLLGDYVDWRGEELEGPRQQWDKGVADLMDLLMDLKAQVARLSANSSNFKGTFHCLIGNHDKLMLDSWRYLKTQPQAKVKPLGPVITTDPKKVEKLLPKPRGADELILHGRFMNWLAVGGVTTIKSFGGFDPWFAKMEDGLGKFVGESMRLGVVINNRQYSHSVSDDPRFWRPIGDLEQMAADAKDIAVEEMIWGRKVMGFDYKTGRKMDKPPQAEVDKMLAGYKVNGIVVGHSLVQALWPVKAYEGKVVNIDMHGNPLSEPWLEDYDDAQPGRPLW